MSGSVEPVQPTVMTVLGPVPAQDFGITDAHNHVWIDPVPGSVSDSPVLAAAVPILAELIDYRQAGGNTLIDCQPGRCGRNGMRLSELAQASQVQIVACTGFHRRRYYAPDESLFQVHADWAACHFSNELELGLEETRDGSKQVRAGFIKLACEATLSQTPLALLEGAAAAAIERNVAIEIHTERGQDAEAILRFFLDRGVAASQIVICHIDKRPDFGLHRSLAQAGVLLEYDTFFRPIYAPQANLWPLIEKMGAAGLTSSLALATDMAIAGMWKHLGGGPGLTGLFTLIKPGLEALGFNPAAMAAMLGGNIICRLARQI